MTEQEPDKKELDEILELEARWREICSELELGKKELEGMINEGEERTKAINEAKLGMFNNYVHTY